MAVDNDSTTFGQVRRRAGRGGEEGRLQPADELPHKSVRCLSDKGGAAFSTVIDRHAYMIVHVQTHFMCTIVHKCVWVEA